MYLQGMQGLQDLANGSVNRAAMVWSEYSGMKMFVLIHDLMVSMMLLLMINHTKHMDFQHA